MKPSVFLFLISVFSHSLIYSQSRVNITPAFPQPGEMMTINFKNFSPLNSNTSLTPEIKFTYSNFYELPQIIPMHYNDSVWTASFRLPPYAVFATFVVKTGDKELRPNPKRHYEITVFNSSRQRVRNSYLYQGYSLGAQEGKSPELAKNQAALYAEELKRYPDNYEAKLRLLAYQLTLADTRSKSEIMKSANKIIADKFYTDPGKMAFTNLTTMGYLIMGEKSRLDSLKEIIKIKYPQSEAGYEFRIGDILSEKDTAKIVSNLEKLLQEENDSNKNYLTEAHKFLFENYAREGDISRTLYHLNFLQQPFTPYTPENLEWQAEVLYKNSILPDSALSIATRAISYADTFPISLIRYFPETGYLPAYVTPEKRKQSTRDVTARLNALRALIYLQLNQPKKAAKLIGLATANTDNPEALRYAAEYYVLTKDYQSAFKIYKEISYNAPDDSTAFAMMKQNYTKWKGNSTGIEIHEKELEDHWLSEMSEKLKKELISKPLPDVLSNYTDLKGQPLSEGLIKKKIVIMDFWATWCVPCMHVMPFLNQVYLEYQNDPEVVFMVVNSGSQNELTDAQNWWGNKTYSFPVYYNKDRTIGEKMGFNLIPATFVIDKQGNIRFKTLGFEGKSMVRKMRAQIEMLKAIR